jgi:hypothetical protein
MEKIDLKYILKTFIIGFLILSFLLFIKTNSIHLSYVEGIQNNSIIMNKSDAFCESHRGSSGALDESCGKLTQTNCNSTSCCVWTSENKCMAGGQGGPTFNSDTKGKTKQLDYYYFQNKCYGDKCPV